MREELDDIMGPYNRRQLELLREQLLHLKQNLQARCETVGSLYT